MSHFSWYSALCSSRHWHLWSEAWLLWQSPWDGVNLPIKKSQLWFDWTIGVIYVLSRTAFAIPRFPLSVNWLLCIFNSFRLVFFLRHPTRDGTLASDIQISPKSMYSPNLFWPLKSTMPAALADARLLLRNWRCLILAQPSRIFSSTIALSWPHS